IPFVLLDFLGSDIEYVAVQFILLLLSHVQNLILRDLITGQHKWQTITNIKQVLLGHGNATIFDRRLRRVHDVFQPLSVVVEGNIEDFPVLARASIAIQSMPSNALTVRVLVACLLEFFFFSSEAMNNLVSGNTPWFGSIKGTFVG